MTACTDERGMLFAYILYTLYTMPFGCVFYLIFIFKNNHKESETIKAHYTYNDRIVHMKYKQRSCINSIWFINCDQIIYSQTIQV